MPLPEGSHPNRPGRDWPWFAGILALGLFAFWPSLRGGWLWDDNITLTGNPDIVLPGGLSRIWFSPRAADYLPLTDSVHWLLWHLWGPKVVVYHVCSLVLHLVSTFLLALLLRRLGVRFAYLGALLFAVHPLAVESVAWISELKNTLALPLLLVAALAFVDWDLTRTRSRWWVSLAAFALAMLAKSAVAPFAAWLVLLQYWRRRKLNRSDCLATFPFWVLAIALSAVTIVLQYHRAIGVESAPHFSFLGRCEGAGLAISFYVGKILWPAGLTAMYPYWRLERVSLLSLWPWAAVAVVLVACWRQRRRWGSHVLLGVGWFLLFLVPSLGLIDMSFHRISWVADHFVYFSLIAAGGGAAALLNLLPIRFLGPTAGRIAGGGGILLAAVLAAISHSYAANFRDPEVFYTYLLSKNPEAWLAENNLGVILAANPQTALPHLQRAVELQPNSSLVHFSLGNSYASLGRFVEAISQYQAAVRLRPNDAEAEENLGNALDRLGKYSEAEGAYREAIRNEPDRSDYLSNLGIVLAKQGKTAEAINAFSRAVSLAPNSAPTHENLANAYLMAGRYSNAIGEYSEALRLNPSDRAAQTNLNYALRASAKSLEPGNRHVSP